MSFCLHESIADDGICEICHERAAVKLDWEEAPGAEAFMDEIGELKARIREQQNALHEQLAKTQELAVRIQKAREILKTALIIGNANSHCINHVLDALEGK